MAARRSENITPKTAKVIATEVARARTRAKLTQTELAKRVGVYQQDVAHLESGERNPTVGMLERVAKATQSALEVRLKPKKKA